MEDPVRRTLQADGMAVRLGCVGQEGMGLPRVRNENIVSMDEGGTNLMWAERFAASSAWTSSGSRCAASRTGSFKDLGMTVLVSMVRQMIATTSRFARSPARRPATPRRRSPHTRRRRRFRPSSFFRRQSLDRAARAAARERRARLSLDTDFDGCMPSSSGSRSKKASTSRTR